jgi:hypothetical protein
MTAYSFSQLIDFTRTSSGTFVGSNGLIQTTPQSRNLLTWTQEFDNAAWTKAATTVTANTGVAPDGTSTADKLAEDATTAQHRVSQTATTVAAAHTFSCYAKASERNFVALYHNQTNASLSVNLTTGATGTISGTIAPTSSSVVSVGNGWWRISITFTATAATNGFTVFVMNDLTNASYAGTAGSGVLIWGAQLEQASTATDYTRNVGSLFPARFDYDPVTLAPRGILIEEQRVNLQTYSNDFSNATWSNTGSSETAGAAVSPDGTTNAFALVEDTSNGVHQISSLFSSGVAGTTYTFSVFLAKNTRTKARVVVSDNATGDGSVIADLDTGTLTTPIVSGNWNTVSATITPFRNNFYRVTLTLTKAVGGNTSVVPVVRLYTTTDSYLGNGTSGIFIYGAQLEAGAFATSYIPTVASQVTRTADQASIVAPMFAPWYNESAGSLVFEGSNLGSSGFTWPVLASAGSSANAFGNYRSASFAAGFIASSSVTQMEITSSPIVANVPYKLGMAAQANNGNFSFNGDIGTNDTTITMPTVNRLSLGSNGAGNAEFFNGHIRRIRYYPTRLSDLQLQALTA